MTRMQTVEEKMQETSRNPIEQAICKLLAFIRPKKNEKLER